MRTEAPGFARALCIAAAALLVASLFASAPSTGGLIRPPWDKLAHFAFYGSIALLLAAGLGRTRLPLAFVLACLVGIADEGYQSTLPGRQAEAWDLLADFAAAALAILGMGLMRNRTRPALPRR